MLAVAILMYVFAGLLLVLGIMNLCQKGFLFNNAYIYATKEERKSMNKKPFYIQSGIVFVILSAIFVLEGFNALYRDIIFLYIALGLVAVVLIFGIVSTVQINKKIKFENKPEE